MGAAGWWARPRSLPSRGRGQRHALAGSRRSMLKPPARGETLHAMPLDATPAPGADEPTDLPWRVLGLLNVFRLLVPMVLLLVFFFDAPAAQRRHAQPRALHRHLRRLLRLRPGLDPADPAALAVRSSGWRCSSSPSTPSAILLFVHASGGVSSGLGMLLILPAGRHGDHRAAADWRCSRPRCSTLALLLQTVVAGLRGPEPGRGLPDRRPHRREPVRDHAARDPARQPAARERGAGAAARHRPRQPERAERVHRAAPAREHPGRRRRRTACA